MLLAVLPGLAPPSRVGNPLGRKRAARWLVGGTMAYKAVEEILATWAGISARSIALVGFVPRPVDEGREGLQEEERG